MTIKALLNRRPVLRLRTRFLMPLLVASLPLALFAGAVIMLLWQHQRDALREGQLDSARALAAAVSADIQSTRMQLEHMAASPLVASESIPAFRARCEELLKIRKDWRRMFLVDRNGDHVFIAESGGGWPGTAVSQSADVRTAIQDRHPVVSDVFTNAKGETLVSLVVPVIQNDEIDYALGAALKLDGFDAVLRSHVQEVTISLLDSQHRIISRKHEADRYRGKHPPGTLMEAMRAGTEGRVQTRTFEDVLVDAVWATVPGTGWKVVIGYPTATLERRLTDQITVLAFLGLLVLVSGAVVALRTSRRLQDGIEAAARRAAEVAEGKHVVIPPTGTVELDLLGQAHFQAAAKIRQTEKERDELLLRERELLVREQNARAVAERANRAKDEFLAMLGHELRNPIAAISNSAQLLHSPRLTPEQQRSARGIIERQTGHLARLIDDLLDVGRMISGKVELRREPVDLAVCVRAGIANAKAGGRGFDHVFRVHCQSTMASADRARMEQVIANLIGNAVKYSPQGSEILLETFEDGDEAVLRVKDNGIGLSKDQLDSVFELFYQAPRAAHRAGGLGIGLTVVKRIVELHGGSVDVASAGQGQGSTFTVRLPRLKDYTATEQAPPVTQVRADPIDVVIVEDNDDARQSLELLLQAEGHGVYTAVDGIQGLNQILDIVPDAAIVDLDLPGIDGYEIARRVRRAGHTSILLIAHSGYGQAQDVARAKEAGFDEHLVKPADMQELRSLMASVRPRAASAGRLVGTPPQLGFRPPDPQEKNPTSHDE